MQGQIEQPLYKTQREALRANTQLRTGLLQQVATKPQYGGKIASVFGERKEPVKKAVNQDIVDAIYASRDFAQMKTGKDVQDKMVLTLGAISIQGYENFRKTLESMDGIYMDAKGYIYTKTPLSSGLSHMLYSKKKFKTVMGDKSYAQVRATGNITDILSYQNKLAAKNLAKNYNSLVRGLRGFIQMDARNQKKKAQLQFEADNPAIAKEQKIIKKLAGKGFRDLKNTQELEDYLNVKLNNLETATEKMKDKAVAANRALYSYMGGDQQNIGFNP